MNSQKDWQNSIRSFHDADFNQDDQDESLYPPCRGLGRDHYKVQAYRKGRQRHENW